MRIKAGLGNQFFQYACGRALTMRNGGTLKLDISDFKTNKTREYGLNHFKIKENIAYPEEVRRTRYPLGAVSIFLGKVARWMRVKFSQTKTFEGNNVGFDPRILKIRKRAYLDGYWQSELYFKDYAETIRADLEPKELGSRATEILRQIQADDSSMSLHIRRGDNAHSQPSIEHFGTPDTEYYEQAIERIAKTIGKKVNIYLFSDEMEWSRQNMNSPFPIISVSQPDIADWEEIAIMSACRHHVISNSTFSWWGAWLNPDPRKIVIAPKHWARTNPEIHKDVIPGEWIRM